jgi:branched-chain amino acid transport system permease protein
MNTKNLKTAFFSALLVLAVAYPVLGLKLTTVGIKLEVHGASPAVLWTIAAFAVFMFFWQLLRDRVSAVWDSVPSVPKMPTSASNFLTLPSTQRWFVLALIVVGLAWPFFGSRGAVDIATLILIYVMLGLGLNIVVGLAGLLDLGYVGFYAVGAYSYALLSHYYGLGFWVCLPIAGLMAAFFGFILGFPVLRLRGDYLAIVTLGFGEIIRILLRNMTELTGGPNGISNIDKPTLFGLSFERRAAEGMQTFHEFFGVAYNSINKVIFLYLIALLLVLLTLFVINRLLRMPIGRAWEALREDEIACRALGMNPTVIKLSAFTLGATFAGFAGSFFAARQGLVTPESFTFIESAIILAIVVLGGMGSQLGIILAAVVMILLPELAREFNEYRMLMFGALMVLMMIWRPQGLLPMQRPHLELKP